MPGEEAVPTTTRFAARDADNFVILAAELDKMLNAFSRKIKEEILTEEERISGSFFTFRSISPKIQAFVLFNLIFPERFNEVLNKTISEFLDVREVEIHNIILESLRGKLMNSKQI